MQQPEPECVHIKASLKKTIARLIQCPTYETPRVYKKKNMLHHKLKCWKIQVKSARQNIFMKYQKNYKN